MLDVDFKQPGPTGPRPLPRRTPVEEGSLTIRGLTIAAVISAFMWLGIWVFFAWLL